MSQAPVGQVYAKVIQEVCDQSQVDFEEGGVDPGTLEKLKSTWQKKISSLHVADLPWEPKSSPAQQVSAGHPPNPVKGGGGNASTLASMNAGPSTRIKAEPGTYPANAAPLQYQMPPEPQYPAGTMLTAPDRAAMALRQQYGERAAPQIDQLQRQGISQRQQGLSSSRYSDPEDRKPTLSSLSSPTMPPAVKTPLSAAQTDGAADSLAEWKAEVAKRREIVAQYPHHGDRLLREHFREMQQRLEGGGLMLPLKERQVLSGGAKRKLYAMTSTLSDSTRLITTQPTRISTCTPLGMAQGDAAGDEDGDNPDADEDAINSDLDDPDEPEGDAENEENTKEAMLCTYDKVQRVKNKWKCTLKDGILQVDGKDYVFHKGQGEFEW